MLRRHDTNKWRYSDNCGVSFSLSLRKDTGYGDGGLLVLNQCQ